MVASRCLCLRNFSSPKKHNHNCFHLGTLGISVCVVLSIVERFDFVCCCCCCCVLNPWAGSLWMGQIRELLRRADIVLCVFCSAMQFLWRFTMVLPIFSIGSSISSHSSSSRGISPLPTYIYFKEKFTF